MNNNKERTHSLNTENKIIVARGKVSGRMGEIKWIKSTLTIMSTVKCIELSNHYIIHVKLT